MRRAGKRVRRKHHDEVYRKRLPVDLAQARDLGIDIAAENVDRDGVAELEAESLGDIGIEGDKRRTGIILGPPSALDQSRGWRHVIGISEAAVAREHPARVWVGLDLLYRHAL